MRRVEARVGQEAADKESLTQRTCRDKRKAGGPVGLAG